MPATSRSGERFRRRSGSERAGSPSKSRIAQPRSGVSIVWPRCRSPWVRMTLPPAPMCESSCSRSRTSWPRPRIGSVRRRLGQLDEHPLDLLVDVRGQDRERLRARLVGGERRVRRLRAEHRVQLARDLAERAHSLEQPLGVARELVEHELPAVARARQVLLQDPERRVDQPALEVVPAGQRRDVREAARGQEAQQLELGVLARLDAPERLQDQRVAEHDRGVRLLDPDRAHVDRAAQGRGGRGRPVEAEHALVDPRPRSPSASGAAARARTPGRRARRRP